ncbi:hypothetical protein BDN71DRAFT_1539626 [Pleurotus eryngii]|uniref:Uncharacterized protein n=1 Tax=Pleurotus eryngii TaxID=5323 RepID=A0A9P6D8Z7_PLEER|nr:hypothetical protein BDN71DRAFT_1539626 [Pleurotus eryngii]
MVKSATLAKPKTGKQKKARGRKSWAKGSKLEFLESFKEEYLATADMRSLYTKITTQFIDKYGYDLLHDEDASDTPPIIINLASLPYDEQETEQERRDEIYDSLRLKIGNWLRHKYKRKQTDQDMVSELLNTISCLAAVHPRHCNAMNIYWAENYASSIKKLFDAHWKKVKNTVPTELRMSMCADFVRAKYEDETEEFRKALEVRANTEYTQALDEYNKRDALNGSPEAYAHAWNEAENFLPVFVDAVAKKFGMSVSLLLVRPLAAEEGNIAMRSVHSHNVGAMTQLMWPKYDNSGFTSTQESLIQYGEAVFSPEERRRRLGLDDEPNATDPMQLIDGPYQPSNEPDPDTFTLTDNRGIDAKQTFASGFFNMGAMQAHMPKTGFTGLMDGDWTQDMQFWNNAPNVFDPEAHVTPTMPVAAASHALSPPQAHVTPTMPVAAASHALSPPQAHHAMPTSQLPPTGGAATATAVPQPVATQSVFTMPTPPPFFGPFGATLSGDITMPLPLPSSTPSPGVASMATTMSPSLPASGSPPPLPLPDSSLVQLTQNNKENLTPPVTGEKHPLDQEPEDSLKCMRRQSKLPSHLEDTSYVAPSKGKRKSMVKPAAKPMPTKRASKKK